MPKDGWTPLVAIKQKWKETRPHENVAILDAIAQKDGYMVMLSIAFEAGRQWQSENPTAKTDFPDYDLIG